MPPCCYKSKCDCCSYKNTCENRDKHCNPQPYRIYPYYPCPPYMGIPTTSGGVVYTISQNNP